LASSIIVCVSIHHGNTLKLARVFAKVLDAEIVKPDEIRPEDLGDYRLAGFGSGIYFGSHHKSLLEFAEKAPEVSDMPAFIFSTSGLPRIPILHDYHKPLLRILRRKGFRIIGEFSCRGYNTHGVLEKLGGMNRGRPNEEDLRRAEAFANNLLKVIEG